MLRRVPIRVHGAAGSFVLSAILVARAVGEPQVSYLELLSLCFALCAVVAGVALCLNDRVESRGTAALVAAGSGIGVVLSTTIGSPGEPPRGLIGFDIGVLILAVAIPVLLLVDLPAKRRGTLARGSTLSEHERSLRARGRGRRPDRGSPASNPRT